MRDWADSVQLVVGDVLDESLTEEIAQGADVMVHLAANTGVGPSVENPRMDCVINVVGTLNCLEAARKQQVRRFVFASSGAPIGEVEPPIHEEMVPRPVSPYGASKLAGEAYCSAYSRTYGVESVALRFGNVYGPGSTHKSSVVAKFIKRAMGQMPLEIYGDGSQTRDFIYIDDLVAAVVAAATVAGVGGEVFQIATSRETAVAELTDQSANALVAAGYQKPEVLFSKPRVGDVRRNFSETSKARRQLGWAAETELELGLSKTIGWFSEQAMAH